MNKKYELTEETRTLEDGTVLHRIRAVRDFTSVDGMEVKAGDLGGWIEEEDNLSHEGSAWVSGEAEVGGKADYAVYKNTWSSGRWFTYTRSDRMWQAGCFRGTGEELVAKAYKDSELSGRCYEAIVRAQEAIDKAIGEEERRNEGAEKSQGR